MDIYEVTSKIFELASKYLDGDISLQNLEDWFVPRIETFLSVPNHNDYGLASLVERRLLTRKHEITRSITFSQWVAGSSPPFPIGKAVWRNEEALW